MAMATDWQRPPRQMIGTAYWYTHTDQWRYDGYRADALTSPLARGHFAGMHTMDTIALSARLGWMPSYPQFDRNPLDLADEIAAGGRRRRRRTSPTGCGTAACAFAIEDPDAPENWPRCLTLWRANLLGSSAKGDEYFLRHLLGTHDNLQAEQTPARPQAPRRRLARRASRRAGKLDLLLSLDFRMTSSTLLSDVVLPGRDLVREARPQHHRHAPVRARVQPRDRPALRVAHRLRRLPRHRPPVLRAGPHPPRGAPRRRRRAAAARHARRDRAARWPGAGLAGRRVSRPSRARRCRTSSWSSATTRPSPRRWPSIGPLIDRLGMTTKAVTYHPDEEIALPVGEERGDARRRGRRPPGDRHRRQDGRGDPRAVRHHERQARGAGLPAAGAAHRHPARRPRRGQRGEAHHLRRHPGPAGPGDHQPGVVGQRDRRAALRPVHRQRRARQALAHPHRAHALPARPRLDARDGRDPADLPRAAGHAPALRRRSPGELGDATAPR